MSGVTQAAYHWMGQLPREHFDMLLVLTNEAHSRGASEATAPLEAHIAALEAQCEAMAGALERIADYPNASDFDVPLGLARQKAEIARAALAQHKGDA
jgi:hypothetical protein